MTSEVSQLKSRIYNPRTRRYQWGSISRVSERLDVARTTVMKWFSGEWEPGATARAAIRALLKDRQATFGNRKQSGRPRTVGVN